jgi:hypothetical protein
MKPTDSQEETHKGRQALWLDPQDIAFIANERRKIPENADDGTLKTWARIAFRAMACLHKAGIPYEPASTSEATRYQVKGNCGES